MQALGSRLRSISYGWWLVAASLPLTAYYAGSVSYSAGLLFDPLHLEFGWSAATISLVISLRRLEGGFIDPLIGFLVDRFGGRPLMIAGQAVIVAGLILLSQIHALWQFFLAYTILSVGLSVGYYGTLTAMLVKWFDAKRGRAMGLLSSAAALGAFLVPGMALLMDQLGWRRAVLLSGIAALAVPMAMKLKRVEEQPAPPVGATGPQPEDGR